MFATLLDPTAFGREPEADPPIHLVACPELTGADPRAVQQAVERLDRLVGRHRALLPVGGDLVAMTREGWLGIPAESLVINPIRDPQSWRSAATWPGERGLILALVPPPGDEEPEPIEVLLWAVRYAASLGGRGLARVGVAGMLPTATARHDVDEANRRIDLLDRLVLLAGANEETLRTELDPRAFHPIRGPRR